jgi:hypothetical protein
MKSVPQDKKLLRTITLGNDSHNWAAAAHWSCRELVPEVLLQLFDLSTN